MAETNGVASKAPLSVTASVSSADGDELRVEAGKVSARGAERYLEFIVPSADLTVRASWKPRVEKGAGARTGEDALPLALVINGSKPIDVVARAGKLYLRDERGISTEPFEDKRLGELGRVLLAIKFKNEPPDLATFSAPAQAKPEGATPFGFFTWTSCVADVAGAGAAIGGAAGAVVGVAGGGTAGGGVGGIPGAVAGAGAGMVVGGTLGGVVGVGACTGNAIYDWLWT